MEMHSIPKPPNQKIHPEIPPSNELEYYIKRLQHHDEYYAPGINDMFLNNINPTFYAMQMQNPDVHPHAQMKRQVKADKFVKAQKPESEELMEIGTFELIPKLNLPLKQNTLISYGHTNANDVQMDN
jgi:hypothetical protein